MAMVERASHPGKAEAPNELAPLLTPEQVSAYLGVPLGTLANWRYQGRGPTSLRVGRHVRYRAQDITDWIHHQLADR